MRPDGSTYADGTPKYGPISGITFLGGDVYDNQTSPTQNKGIWLGDGGTSGVVSDLSLVDLKVTTTNADLNDSYLVTAGGIGTDWLRLEATSGYYLSRHKGSPKSNRLSAPPGSEYVDTKTGKIYDKTVTNAGPAGWVERSSRCRDSFEPNSHILAATPISPGNWRGLSVCSTDDDYYSMHLKDGETIVVDALFSHAQGDIDVHLYSPDRTRVVHSRSVTDDEKVTHTAKVSGTYSIHVELLKGGTTPGNSYTLKVSVQ